MRRLLAAALFVVALVVGWRFAGENSAGVSVHYLIGESAEVSLWAVLLGAFAGGAAVAGMVGLYFIAKLKLVARRYRKTASDLEAEVHQLRNLPLDVDESAADAMAMTGSSHQPVLGRGA